MDVKIIRKEETYHINCPSCGFEHCSIWCIQFMQTEEEPYWRIACPICGLDKKWQSKEIDPELAMRKHGR